MSDYRPLGISWEYPYDNGETGLTHTLRKHSKGAKCPGSKFKTNNFTKIESWVKAVIDSGEILPDELRENVYIAEKLFHSKKGTTSTGKKAFRIRVHYILVDGIAYITTAYPY